VYIDERKFVEERVSEARQYPRVSWLNMAFLFHLSYKTTVHVAANKAVFAWWLKLVASFLLSFSLDHKRPLAWWPEISSLK